MRRYERFAYWVANNHVQWIPGSTYEDRNQEALFGLYVAIRRFRSGRVPFKHFAALVIRRHLTTALLAARREKHGPLNGSDRLGLEGVADDRLDPVRLISARDRLRAALDGLPELTETEARSVVGLALGLAYAELGDEKRVDNAYQRGRKKLLRAAA